MRRLRLASLAFLLPAALLVLPARALAFGFGVEGGGTFTQTSGMPGADQSNIWTLNGGIIIENNFGIGLIFLDLWADVQTPLELQTGPLTPAGTASSKYVPIDLGLRLGLNFGLLQPYVGILGQVGILTDSAGTPNLNNPLWGLGGDLGLDFAFFFLRVGAELRLVESLSALANDPIAGNHGSATEFEALASVRLSF